MFVLAIILRLFPAKPVPVVPDASLNNQNNEIGTPTDNVGAPSQITEDIKVNSPKQNDVIKSPVNISGEARGTWFFEASFPVTILDANRKVLARVPIQATADWMTTDFVPFMGSVAFTKSTTTTGFILFENDNPSGDIQKSKSIEIPINFEQ